MTVSLATVYNWISLGKNGRKLEVLDAPCKLTTPDRVREFLRHG